MKVEAVVATGEVKRLYNFRVADYHTYFVGGPEWGFSVWSHNQCKPKQVQNAAGTWHGLPKLNYTQAKWASILLNQGASKNAQLARYLSKIDGVGPATIAKLQQKFAPQTSTHQATFGKASSNDYKKTFFTVYPNLKGKVIVHHAVEQQTLKRYPTTVKASEIHSLENLRGIPKGSNSTLHLSTIRKAWNLFYAQNPKPTRQALLNMATALDLKFGSQFIPPI